MDFDTMIGRYLATWNETDPDKRRAAVDEVFAADVRFVDPLAAVEGRAAVDALIAGAQSQFAGLVFTPGDLADTHHDLGRFTWHLGPAGEEPLVIGFDVVEWNASGEIELVLGFIDKMPPS